MRKAAIKIEAGDKTWRFGEERVILQEDIGGQTVDTYYIPYLLEFGFPTEEISIEGDPPVPTIDVTVWDGYGDLRTQLEGQQFEAVTVTSFVMDEEGTILRTDAGYLADPTFDSGQVSFTIRLEEDASDEQRLSLLSFNTFQKFNILSPTAVEVAPRWQYHEDTPWVTELSVIPGGTLKWSVAPGDTSLKVLISNDDPYLSSYVGVLVTTENLVKKYFKPELSTSVGLVPAQWNLAADAICIFDAVAETIRFEPLPGSGTVTHTSLVNTSFSSHIQIVGSESWDGVYKLDSVDANYIYLDAGSNGPSLGESGESFGVRIYPGNLQDRIPTGGAELLAIGSKNSGAGGRIETIDYSSASFVYADDGSKRAIEISGIPSSGPGSIKYAHTQGEAVTAAGTAPSLIVQAGGFIPLSDDNQTMKLGFCYVEGDIRTNPINRSQKFRATNRYEIDAETTIDTYRTGGSRVIKLDLHTNHLIHDYGVRGIYNTGYQPMHYDIGTQVQFVDFQWLLSSLTFRTSVFAADQTLSSLARRGSYKGKRIDMLSSYGDLLYESRLGLDTSTPTDFAEQNARVVENVKAFAISTDSELSLGGGATPQYVMTLKFQTPEWAVGAVESGYIESEDVEGSEYDQAGDTAQLEVPFTNQMVYNFAQGTFAEQSGDPDVGKSAAEGFFRKQRYRMIERPIPQNSDSVGSAFPIVFGYVEKIPLVHAIAQKIVKEDQITSGDDVYIYASHPCEVSGPEDITIHMEEADQEQGDYVRVASLPASSSIHAISSPFPKIAYNHTDLDVLGNIVGGGKLMNPYHKLRTERSNDELDYYGIQLRGSEWHPELGPSDKRYPIRFGVGSSKLVASFVGYREQHPADIIEALIKRYGRYPFTEDLLDEDNLETIKSLTRRLRAAVYIDTLSDTSSVILKICKEFGILVFRGEKLNFVLPDFVDFADIDYSKPLSDGYNIIHGVTAKDAGSQTVYNRVLYHYRKNWSTGKYEATIDLNSRNNRYCAQANRAVGAKKTFEIEADWVNIGGVAQEVANRWAARVARHRIEYTLEVKYRDGIVFEPGDVVPMTHAALGLNSTPVLVSSVTPQRGRAKLTVERYL